MGNTGILDVLGALSGKPTTEGPIGILSRPMPEPPIRGALSTDGSNAQISPRILRLLLGGGGQPAVEGDRLTQVLAMLKANGLFGPSEPARQLAFSEDLFSQAARGAGLDPGSNEYHDQRTKWRDRMIPHLKISRTPIDDMSTMERVFMGTMAGAEDLGLGATQLGNEALRMVGAPGAGERAVELRREAKAMRARKRPLYDTAAGKIGSFLPAFAFPGKTLRGALASGSVYAGLQPQPEEGQRLKSIFRNLFGLGQ